MIQGLFAIYQQIFYLHSPFEKVFLVGMGRVGVLLLLLGFIFLYSIETHVHYTLSFKLKVILFILLMEFTII